MSSKAPTTPPRLASPGMLSQPFDMTPSPQKAAAMTAMTKKHAASSPAPSPGRGKMREIAGGSRMPVATTTTTATQSDGGVTTMTEATMTDAIMIDPEVIEQQSLRDAVELCHEFETHWREIRKLQAQIKELCLKNLMG